jgi:hypothetical protein
MPYSRDLENPGERGAEPVKQRGYRPGRKPSRHVPNTLTGGRQAGKKTQKRPENQEKTCLPAAKKWQAWQAWQAGRTKKQMTHSASDRRAQNGLNVGHQVLVRVTFLVWSALGIPRHGTPTGD